MGLPRTLPVHSPPRLCGPVQGAAPSSSAARPGTRKLTRSAPHPRPGPGSAILAWPQHPSRAQQQAAHCLSPLRAPALPMLDQGDIVLGTATDAPFVSFLNLEKGRKSFAFCALPSKSCDRETFHRRGNSPARPAGTTPPAQQAPAGRPLP